MTSQLVRVRAPELSGRGWLNTGGTDLSILDLRGKIVILDFWTFCCANCLHVLDELRPIEDEFSDVLVVIGVHSPKFAHERDPQALAAAVERYGVAHPVLDDPDLNTWQQYAARAWPTLAVIDPEGYLVASMAGEGHAAGLTQLIEELIATHDAKGTLHRGVGPYVPPTPAETTLRFPGKAVVLSNGNFLVSDSAHHSVVEFDIDGETVRRRLGTGIRGHQDGSAVTAEFNEPQGLCVLPPGIVAQVGYHVVVADTVNHLLRGINLETEQITTVAGTGRQWRLAPETQQARAVDLSSPWDVAWHEGQIIVAMAGIHQLWWFDPIKETIGVYAGTTTEALRDGPLPDVWLAQPSGLASDGKRLWFVDSETSALRYIETEVLHTAIGQGLFDFGLVDGSADEALLQHPMGVGILPDETVAVADTYNGAIRRYDPDTKELTTIAIGLNEPSDVIITGEAVVIVESAAHRLIRLAPTVQSASGARYRTERPVTDLAPGEVTLEIAFTPPVGQKLDDSFGPPIQISVEATPSTLLLDGAGDINSLTRKLHLTEGQGTLTVIAQVATCDEQAEYPACHLARQDWGVPIRVTKSGADRLALPLFDRS